MTNSSESENEEKLIALFKATNRLEKKKRQKAIRTFLITFISAILFYFLLNYVSHLHQAIIFEPDSTIIDMSENTLRIIGVVGAILCFYFYMTTRHPFTLLLVPLLIFALKDGANPLLHMINEVSVKQYNDIRLVLKTNPQLIPIIPNYVNDKCEMTTSNYEKMITLADNFTNNASSLTDLPVTKTVNDVKKMCVLTIFRI